MNAINNQSFDTFVPSYTPPDELIDTPNLLKQKFSSKTEAIDEAIEQIRVTKLGLRLNELNWEELHSKFDLLEILVLGTAQIMKPNPAYRNGRFHNDFLHKQNTASRRFFSIPRECIKEIREMTENKLKKIKNSRFSECEEIQVIKKKLKDIKKQLQKIESIFSDRVFRT